MEPIMVIDLLDTHGRVQARHRLAAIGVACKIGRSVACDIVLDDAYAAAEHTTLTLLDDGRVAIADLNSRNGTRLNGKRIGAAAFSVEDGELIVGRTRLRIRTAHTTLPPERLFRRDVLQRYKTPLAVAGLLLVLSYAAFDQWLAAPERLAPRMLATMLGVATALGIWIGLWALITRIGHGAWTLRTHIAIAANATALGAWSSWLLELASFALQRQLTLLAALIAISAVMGALYLHLRKATHLSARTAAVVAASIPLVIGITVGWLNQQNANRDVNRIALGADVYPPQLRIAPSTDLNDYLAHASSLKRDANRKRQQSLAEMPLAAK
jgi:FHA domain